MRWANFGDSFWYLDAMGAKAANGYSVFCRQDFIGIDYGILDCQDQTPLPDFYASLLWSKTMGSQVLAADSSSPFLRAYAHCGTAAAEGSVTLLLINVGWKPVRISLILEDWAGGMLHGQEYVLAGAHGPTKGWVPGGINSTVISVNRV